MVNTVLATITAKAFKEFSDAIEKVTHYYLSRYNAMQCTTLISTSTSSTNEPLLCIALILMHFLPIDMTLFDNAGRFPQECGPKGVERSLAHHLQRQRL